MISTEKIRSVVDNDPTGGAIIEVCEQFNDELRSGRDLDYPVIQQYAKKLLDLTGSTGVNVDKTILGDEIASELFARMPPRNGCSENELWSQGEILHYLCRFSLSYSKKSEMKLHKEDLFEAWKAARISTLKQAGKDCQQCEYGALLKRKLFSPNIGCCFKRRPPDQFDLPHICFEFTEKRVSPGEMSIGELRRQPQILIALGEGYSYVRKSNIEKFGGCIQCKYYGCEHTKQVGGPPSDNPTARIHYYRHFFDCKLLGEIDGYHRERCKDFEPMKPDDWVKFRYPSDGDRKSEYSTVDLERKLHACWWA